MKKDLNEIAAIEKAIEKKYGSEAVKNPKSSWDDEKEKRYLEELKQFYNTNNLSKVKKKIGENFYIKEREKPTKIERSCPVCGVYSFSVRDDLYMSKFDCCYLCYVKYAEGREERWFSGWRPKL
tara:strand:- start:1930 stop:2301 length:372 start_codon:yes stop_codon:yes gene_type:complete